MLHNDIRGYRMDPDLAPNAVAARIALRASDLGLPAPHKPVHLSVRWADDAALLVVRPTSSHPLVELAPWLDALGARTIRREEAGLCIQCHDLSRKWARLFRNLRLEAAQLLPDGTAILEVVGGRSDVIALSHHLAQEGSPLRVDRVAPTRPLPSLLTHSQDEAIRTAVAQGYYEIPRPINLHQLAERMGVSSGSLSERLRRAEQRLVMRYVEKTGAAGQEAAKGPGHPRVDGGP